MLKILTAPNKILGSSVKPVEKIAADITKLVLEMEKTLIAQNDPPGVGLAAPQVGKKLALFIIKPTKKAKIKVFINPKILKRTVLSKDSPYKKTKKNHVKLEGCLSIPRIWGPVKRASRVLVEYQTLTGLLTQRWFQGLEAIIIQHEIDHLTGVLFTQRALEQNLPLYEEKKGKLEKIEDYSSTSL